MESTSLTKLTFNPDLAAVTFSDGFDNCKSKTGAALSQRLAVCASIKLFKQTRQVAFGNANAAVLHSKRQSGGRCLKLNHHLSTIRRVLERILHQVINGLM